ncbi:hypothetical protein MBLNU230_g8491t1 [Neophaeotheca triangularis]
MKTTTILAAICATLSGAEAGFREKMLHVSDRMGNAIKGNGAEEPYREPPEEFAPIKDFNRKKFYGNPPIDDELLPLDELLLADDPVVTTVAGINRNGNPFTVVLTANNAVNLIPTRRTSPIPTVRTSPTPTVHTSSEESVAPASLPTAVLSTLVTVVVTKQANSKASTTRQAATENAQLAARNPERHAFQPYRDHPEIVQGAVDRNPLIPTRRTSPIPTVRTSSEATATTPTKLAERGVQNEGAVGGNRPEEAAEDAAEDIKGVHVEFQGVHLDDVDFEVEGLDVELKKLREQGMGRLGLGGLGPVLEEEEEESVREE